MDFKNTYKSYIKSFNETTYNNYFADNNFSITVTTDKELSESAVYVIWWFNENGFTGRMTTNNSAKTEWKVEKDNTTDIFTLTASNQNPKRCDIKKYMDLFNNSFKLKQEIDRLKRIKEGK